jgi:hypothetical protein
MEITNTACTVAPYYPLTQKLRVDTRKKLEHRLRVFENRVLRGILGLKRDEVTGENCIMRSFVICTLRQV